MDNEHHEIMPDAPNCFAEQMSSTCPTYEATQLLADPFGDEEPTQLLDDDYFNEKETQILYHHEGAGDFQETQLLDNHDDTPFRLKGGNAEAGLEVPKLETVDSDAETEDGEDDGFMVEPGIKLQEQEASTEQLCSMQLPIMCTDKPEAEDKGIGDEVSIEPMSPNCRSLGSFRVESMRVAASHPLLWKPSIIIEFPPSKDQETCKLSDVRHLIPKHEVAFVLPDVCNDQEALQEEVCQGRELGNIDKIEEQSQHPLEAEPADLEEVTGTGLYKAAEKNLNNQKAGVLPEIDSIRVEGLIASLPDEHDQVPKDSVEPEWMVRKPTLDDSIPFRVFERRKSNFKVSFSPENELNLDGVVKAGVQAAEDEGGKGNELGEGQRPRKLFAETLSSEDKAQSVNVVHSRASSKSGMQRDGHRKENLVLLGLRASLDGGMSSRSRLFFPGGSMSYLDSQEPGEERQAQALNMVDKLVWLNNADSQSSVLPRLIRGYSGNLSPTIPSAKTPAQVDEAHLPSTSLGVYEWVDSQHDGAGSTFSIIRGSETKTVPAAKSDQFGSGLGAKTRKRFQKVIEGKQKCFRKEGCLKDGKKYLGHEHHIQKTKSQRGQHLESKVSRPIANSKASVVHDHATKLQGRVRNQEELCKSEDTKGMESRRQMAFKVLENPGVEAPNMRNPSQVAQFVTKRTRRSVPLLITESDDLILISKRPSTDEKVRWNDKVGNDKPSIVEKKLSDNVSTREYEEGEEEEDETLAKWQKATKSRVSMVRKGVVEEAQRQKSPKGRELQVSGFENVDDHPGQDTGSGVQTRRAEGPVRSRSANSLQRTNRPESNKPSLKAGTEKSPTNSRKHARSNLLMRPAAEDRKCGNFVGSQPHLEGTKRRKIQSSDALLSILEAPTLNARTGEHVEELEEGVSVVKRSNGNTEIATNDSLSRVVPASGTQEKVESAPHAVVMDTVARRSEVDTATPPLTPLSSTPPTSLSHAKHLSSSIEVGFPLDPEENNDLQAVVRSKESQDTTDPANSAPATPSLQPHAEYIPLAVTTRSGRTTGKSEKSASLLLSKRKKGMDIKPNELHAGPEVTCNLNSSNSPSTTSTMKKSINREATSLSLPQVEDEPLAVTTKSGRTAKKSEDNLSILPSKRRKGVDISLDKLGVANDVSPMIISGESPSSTSTAEKRRKRRASSIRVLFSHGIKGIVGHQGKILDKLGGRVVKTSAECTHFVTDQFQRTGNMLEAMARGKPVVTPIWLDSCAQAQCFLDERKFILEDEKKEKELGFSMFRTISAAQQKGVLQGLKVHITKHAGLNLHALGEFVTAAGGQVVDSYTGSLPKDSAKNNLLVISNELDYDVCLPYLKQGINVYSPEIIFDAIITHHLDFTKHKIFEN